MFVLLRMCCCLSQGGQRPRVISVVSSLSLEASAPRAVCCGSAEHLRLSDKGGGCGWGWGVLGLCQRGTRSSCKPGQGQDAQRAVVCGSERAQALSMVGV